MFNKLPIIASDVTGINNVLTDNVHALLFPVNDSNVLCNKIREMISDDKLSQKLAENAYKLYCEKYSFDRTISELLDIYNKYE